MSPKKFTVPIRGAAVLDATVLDLNDHEPLAALLAAARERGRREALAEAPRDAAKLLAEIASKVEQQAQGLHAEAAKTALELGLVIAREFILRDVSLGEHDIEGMVRSVLAAASSDRGQCIVHVNPVDAATLAGSQFRTGTTVEADPGIRMGDVQVQTPMGTMIRDLDETLSNLSTRLREELK